jgi:hypothetical protein
MPIAEPVVLTVATEGLSELHVKVRPVIVFPAESWAVALNWCVCPTDSVQVDGATTTLETDGVTIIAADPVTLAVEATMCAVPWLLPVASPFESTVLTEGVSELQEKVTPAIGFPLASFAVEINCCVFPGAIVAEEGDRLTLATVGVVPTFVVPEPPQPTRERTTSGKKLARVARFLQTMIIGYTESTIETPWPSMGCSQPRPTLTHRFYCAD